MGLEREDDICGDLVLVLALLSNVWRCFPRDALNLWRIGDTIFAVTFKCNSFSDDMFVIVSKDLDLDCGEMKILK